MARIAVGVEYDGSAYAGWQAQPAVASIQAVTERALSRIADAPVALVCAGRTDAGVHASGQVAHFDTAAERSVRSWVLGANSELPADVSLGWAQPVPDHFHARYSAARALVGEHDFSAFRAAECQAKSPIRRLEQLSVVRCGDWLTIEATANAFLHHMVRNIAGLLIRVGRGDAAPAWAREVLEGRDRTLGAPTAPAAGLYLVRVRYPAVFALPAPPLHEVSSPDRL